MCDILINGWGQYVAMAMFIMQINVDGLDSVFTKFHSQKVSTLINMQYGSMHMPFGHL